MSSIVFVGGRACGKTTCLCLMYHTALRYGPEIGIVSVLSIIRNPALKIDQLYHKLIIKGEPPEPTPPPAKDLKFELRLTFLRKGFLRRTTHEVTLVAVDLAGEITNTLLKILPDIVYETPSVVKSRLAELGIDEEDAERIVTEILRADGFILVADCTKLESTEEDNPDIALFRFLNNLIMYMEAHQHIPRGIALLLTKLDTWWHRFGKREVADRELVEFLKTYMPQVTNYLRVLQNRGVSIGVFCSWILPQEKTETGDAVKFQVDTRKREVVYSVDQYKKLLSWLAQVFAE